MFHRAAYKDRSIILRSSPVHSCCFPFACGFSIDIKIDFCKLAIPQCFAIFYSFSLSFMGASVGSSDAWQSVSHQFRCFGGPIKHTHICMIRPIELSASGRRQFDNGAVKGDGHQTTTTKPAPHIEKLLLPIYNSWHYFIYLYFPPGGEFLALRCVFVSRRHMWTFGGGLSVVFFLSCVFSISFSISSPRY